MNFPAVFLRNKLQSTNKVQFDYVDENLSSSFFINSLPAEYKQGDSMSIQQNDNIKVNFLTLPQVVYIFTCLNLFIVRTALNFEILA